MKKLTLIVLIAFTSISTFAQKLDNEVYFRFGYSVPSWNHFGVDKDTWAEGIKRYGGNFEFGTIFMIQSVPAAENMALGIDVDYLYSNITNFNNNAEGYEQNLVIARMGSKIGPSFSYSPVNKLVFDVYAKADIAWATIAVPFEGDITDADDFFMGKPALGFSTGLNFRYGILMLGIEYDIVSPELESDDYKGEYFQEMLEFFIGEGDSGKKSKLPCINFTIGLSF